MKNDKIKIEIKYADKEGQEISAQLVQFPKDGVTISIEDYTRFCSDFAKLIGYHPNTTDKFFDEYGEIGIEE